MKTNINTCLKPKALLLSTAFGLMLLPASQAMAQNERESASNVGDAEIVVTARKQSESSLDVPMGLTALSGAGLESEQSYRLEDFVGKVPGLNISEAQGTQLVIRGIASSSTSINAPVATYIDDTPLVGVGAFSGGSSNTPNLDTFDLNRVEVLKGPQGTLYGATALGGVLKYVTNAPDPSGFAAKLQGGLTSVAHSDDSFGHSLHGMINMPLADNLAFRAVGYHNEYQGYVDVPSQGKEDIDNMRIYGGRASLLWDVTPDLSIRLSALNQQRRWDGMSFVEVEPGTREPRSCTYCQTRIADQNGDSSLEFYNATINWDLGGVKLTSSTTYDKWQYRSFVDLIVGAGTIEFIKGEPGSGNWTLLVDFNYWGNDFVHETRLASDRESFWNWQVGIYYTAKEASQDQRYLPWSRVTQQIVLPEIGGSFQPTTYKEFAAFGNLNFEVTPEFDISVGGRISDQSQTFEQIGRIVSPSLPLTTMDDSVFTWSTDARWRFTEGSMIYARIATGFVPGGPNVAAFGAIDIPRTYKSSTTTNYELGIKSTLLNNKLTAELAVYQIDWEDLQVSQTFGIYNALNNAGAAVSRGVEFSLNYKPVQGLTLGFNGAYTDAHLTEDPQAGVRGFEGDRLPVTPRWQLAASADYRWPMLGATGFAGADWRYISRRFAELSTSPLPSARQQMPGYHVVDLRAGVELERWRLAFYVKNVGDARGISYLGQEIGLPYYRAYLTTPRTFGVDLSVNF